MCFIQCPFKMIQSGGGFELYSRKRAYTDHVSGFPGGFHLAGVGGSTFWLHKK